MRRLKPTPRVVALAIRAKTSKFSRLRRAGRITVGKMLLGTPKVRIFDGDPDTSLQIGHFCCIADNATFMLGGMHPTDRRSTYPIRIMMGLPDQFSDGFPSTRGDIIVGNDVWIGHGAIVMSGVTIGDGAIVGACAVVTSDVAPYSIVAGNPARFIRLRYPEHVAAEVQALAWWDWPIEKIAENADFLNREVLGE